VRNVLNLYYLSKSLSKSGSFSKILCFSQPDFQTFFAHSFVMDIAIQHFIYNRSSLEPIIHGQQELGAHTDILEFRSDKLSTFRWTHHGARPLGFEFINQCAGCLCLKTLKPSVFDNDTRVVLQCSICKKNTTYNFPHGWSWTHDPPMKDDERGAWIVRVE
jgi:hypothetical protein